MKSRDNQVNGVKKDPDKEVGMFVQDNEIGFEEDKLEMIFHPFQRLHGRNAYEGSGIGMPS